MPGDGFTSVSLPTPVVERLDRVLKRDRTYRSRGELVKAFTLKGLDEMEKGAA